MLGEGQKDLELGPGTWASQVGQEQGEGVQAMGGQGLVIQQQVQQVVVCKRGHVTMVLDGGVSKYFRCPDGSST